MHFYTDVPLPQGDTFEDYCVYLGLPPSLRDIVMVLGAQDVIDK